ncbi:unnamed protein product [Effrenium voratum]|nr:unnamed protein product [Effrenium voratum]
MPGWQLTTLQAGIGGPWRLPDLGAGQFSIGRKACCQLVLPESYAYVSGEHCRLKRVDTGEGPLLLEDLSGNGTFVNASRVGRGKTQVVNAGDEISLAKPTRKGGAIKFCIEACETSSAPDATVPGAPAAAWVPTPPERLPERPRVEAPTDAAVALAAAMARDAQQRQAACAALEGRVAAERANCARLEEELREAQQKLQASRGAGSARDARNCEERESYPEAEATDRRESMRLRAELEEEQRCAQRAEEENSRLRSEVQEASSRTLALEAEVKRESDFNASLEEQAAAACAEWSRSREAVTVARRRLEERGAALTTLRTAMRQYHQKVSDRLGALERCLHQVSESPSQTLEPRRDGVSTSADAGARHVGSEETPTQDADAAAGGAVASEVGSQSQGFSQGGQGGAAAKRPRR